MCDLKLANRILEHAAQDNNELSAIRHVDSIATMGGGDINRSFQLRTDQQALFLKINQPQLLPMFRAEMAGLEAISASNTIRSCAPLCCGIVGDHSYLLLEFLPLNSEGDWAAAGEMLALMHSKPQAAKYGFAVDSYCGRSRQCNDPHGNWAEFFARQRIGRQLATLYQLPIEHPLIQTHIEKCVHRLQGHQPPASLLHGDLWRGNIAFCRGQPVIFDPAIYLGDSETDLAMSELFGRFPKDFYRAYNAVRPVSPDYPGRRELYQLYHVLNHANLFGGGYRRDAERRLQQL